MDKKLINRATANNEEPTPGYLFKDLIEMTYLDISSVQSLVDFLSTKVKDSIEDEESYSLIKTLKVIRQLCVAGHEEFQSMMQHHVDVLKSAICYRGGLSHTDGNATGKIVKLCAREAIEALYVPHKKVRMTAASSISNARVNTDERRHSSHPNQERIADIYKQQHLKSAYVAPKVPMAQRKESIKPINIEAEQQVFLGETDFIQDKKMHLRQTIENFNRLERDIERPDLNRLHEGLISLLKDWQTELFWEEVSIILNEALSIGSSWKAKLNSTTVIEFLLEKDVPMVLQFFGENRTNLLECLNGVHFSLRKKVTRVLGRLPACRANLHAQEKVHTKIGEEKLDEIPPKPIFFLGRGELHVDKNRINRRQPLVSSLSEKTHYSPKQFSTNNPPNIDDFFTSKSELRPNSNVAKELPLDHSTNSPDDHMMDFSDLHDVLHEMISP
ncbi:ccaat-box dna binding protein subunit b [Perkinsela sp. CCAP 1560/4]|nr:ccaat-box dna binding protein subunit b [Perkinsela sp. CCAP 1560/4]|eukprot:KNH09716.1 ccaat-box dna binding protein subunit b [Perkinsela sp. CCAP 1560/4]